VVDGPTAADGHGRTHWLEGYSPAALYPAGICRVAPSIPLAVAVRSACVQARSVPVRDVRQAVPDVRQAVPDVLPAPGDAWRGFRPALSPASRLAVVAAQRDLRVLLMRALSPASRLAAGAAQRGLRLVLLLALLRGRLAFQAAALRLRQAWFAGCPAVPDDPVHATRAAASRRDNKRESRETTGKKSVFSLP
jgi:hypothetical protein